MAGRLQETTDAVFDPATLVARFATYLKAIWVYPENNRRVIEAADDVVQMVRRRAAEKGERIEVKIFSDEFLVEGFPVAVDGPQFTWARKLFRGSALAGVEFGDDLVPKSLSTFAEHLRDSSPSGGRAFHDTFDGDLPGLHPIELVFHGGHERGDGSGEAGRGTPMDPVENLLIDSDRIRDRLRALNDTLSFMRGEELEGHFDLVAELKNVLPAEALAGETGAEDLLDEMLASLQRDLTALGDEALDAGFAKLALDVAKKYFNVEIAQLADRDDLPTGRPSDRKITDSLEELLVECQDIPRERFSLGRLNQIVESDVVKHELTGVYLWLLSYTKNEATCRALERCLESVLEEPTEQQWAMIGRYLEAQDPEAPEVERIDSRLVRCGVGPVLFDRGHWGTSLVASAFPHGFWDFVDSLTVQTSDISRLAEVLRQIPSIRLADGGRMMEQSGELTEERADKLFATGAAMRPLAAELANSREPWLRKRITRYLLGEKLPRSESAALYAVEPPEDLPSAYIESLCHLEAGESDPMLVRRSGGLICDFLRRTHCGRKDHDQRVQAILALRATPCREAVDLLEKIVDSGRLKLGRRTREIRRYAREVLADVRDAMESES